MSERERLAALCESLGAPPAQAAVMAAQLAKRADQIAGARGIPRDEALRGLLEVMVKGRAGQVPERFAAPPAPDG